MACVMADDVGLGERAVERRAAMAARAEADQLRRIVQIGLPLVVLPLEPGQVDQHGRRGRLASQRGNRGGLVHVVDHRRLHHATGHGFRCQMSAAYSAIVRSLENFPELATLRMAFRAQALGSAYNCAELASASQVRRQVGQVHVVVAVREQRLADRREDPRLVAAEVIGEDQIERRADFRLVLVVPVRVVPAAAVHHLLGGQAEQEEVLLAGFLRPSRWWRRRACRRSAPRSS